MNSDTDDSNSIEDGEAPKPLHHGLTTEDESLSAALTHRVQHLQALQQQLQQRPPGAQQQPEHSSSPSEESLLMRDEMLQRQQLLLLQEQRRRQLEEQQLIAMNSMLGSGGGGYNNSAVTASQLQERLLQQRLLQLQNEERLPPELRLASQLATGQQHQQQYQQNFHLDIAARQQLLLRQQLLAQQQQLLAPSMSDVMSPSAASDRGFGTQSSLQHLIQMGALPSDAFSNPSVGIAPSSSTLERATSGGCSATTGVGYGSRGRAATNKPKKEKNRPKRPLSAYNIFFREERARILEEIKTPEETEAAAAVAGSEASATAPSETSSKTEDDTAAASAPSSPAKGNSSKRRKAGHGKISFENLAKVVGQRWQDLRPEQIGYYKEKASLDSERYRKEMEVFQNRGKPKADDGIEDTTTAADDDDRKLAATARKHNDKE